MKKAINFYIVGFVVFLLFWLVIYWGLNSIDTTGSELGLRTLRDAITRSCAHSYATTGAYPTSIEDMIERYGVQIDDEKYIVHYDVFASNIMPDVTVIVK